jgi:hypothetical protein
MADRAMEANELMLLIEARFTDVQITDHDAEIEFVGDLVRHIEIVDDAKARPKTDDLSH